ncbi:ATPase family AAA domain-containing protein [Acorus calamus]|uniref:ATPase family AAA domain-containing protein n=1 Tax=Acorus calamus TaxID=4465 RepID=A0AAV9CBW6_ACOCL|nr:ATPase family AAA domain-containing protein [Acorus calamus]
MKEVVILPLLYPEFYSSMGITPPRGVLLHGYPGTGKTLVVRALIGACSRGDKKIAYFARKGADCLGKYVGDAERQLRLLFHVAEKSQPAIIFFDEIDGLAPCRSRQQDQTHCSVVSTLLALLDGVKSRGSVIVIGATNRPDAVDPALRRPGRFDREIYFPLPSVMDRSAILSLHTRSWPKPISEPVLSWVAKQTVGFAGADLQALCTQAAIIALKRNCSLKGLMSSAEKSFIHGKRILLPSIVVEETDWLAALSCVPPPCSRREAGMAANDVFSSPLHPHLIPCLLQPLLHLLISLSLEECVWLPPTLYKGSKLMKDIIFSALKNKRISVALWCSHLQNLIQEPDVTKEIEKGLYRAGLLDGLSDYYLDQSDGEGKNDDWKSVLFQLNSSGTRMFSKSLLCFSNPLGKKTGFRVLITGSPRSGQHHLASCFLHGFVGHIEIRKIDLATISQEGHGDIIRGVTHILLQCLSLGRCIIYLPRIDLWALEEICQQPSDEENNIYPKKISNIFETPCPQIVTKNMSQAWKSFVEQVDSVCTPPSFIIVATCEVPNHDLPLGIRGFFNDRMVNGTCTHLASSAQTVPQYALQVDGKLNHDVMVDASAIKLSQDLIQKFVYLIHHKTHMAVECETNNCNSANDILEVQRDNVEGKVIESVDEPVDSERITSNGGASCSNKGYQQYLDGDKSLPSICKICNHYDQEVQMHHHHGACVRTNNKILKGKSNIMLAIATFGYQILCYPHFAELCWATSGLKEGPSADIHGPWKGWPFNSCIVRPPSSSDKVAMGSYPGNEKNKENFSIVRGLIAVGLLAYRGLYSSVLEVSCEVRNVLELLLGEINSKILGGKDKFRFIRLLSQVAYLEDMVNSWAYSFQRSQLDNQMPASIVRPMPGVTMNTQNYESNTNLSTCLPHVSNKSSQEENSTCINSSKDLADNGLPSSDMIDAVPRPSQDKLLLTTDTDSCQNSFSVFSSVAHGDTLNELKKTGCCEPCQSENHEPCELVYQRSQTMKQDNGSAKADGVSHSEEDMGIMDNCISRKDMRQCNGLSRTGTVLSSNVGGCIHAETVRDDVSNTKENNSVPAMPACICVYECCSGCCHAIHTLIRKVLSDSLESYGYLTIDDVHDVVASCSVSLSAKIQKYFFTRNSSCDDRSSNQQQNGIDAMLCACQYVGNQLNKMPHQCGNVKNMENLPAECGNHRIGQEDTALTDVHKSSSLGPGLKFFFRDGTLVPSHSINNIVLHCKIENLCICALTESIMKNQKDFSLML